MPGHRLTVWTFLLVCVSLLLSAPASAQSLPALSPTIAQVQESLRADTNIPAGQRDVLMEILERAAKDDAQADSRLAAAGEYKKAADASQLRIEALESELQTDPSISFQDWRDQFDPDASATDLRETLSTLQASATQLSSGLSDTLADLNRVDQRPAAISRDLEMARRKASDLANRRQAVRSGSLTEQIESLSLQAGERAQLATIQALEAERAGLPVEARRLELEQRSLQRQSTLVRRQIDVVEATLARSTEAELTALGSRLKNEADVAGGESSLLTVTASANLAYGQELSDTENASRHASETLRQTQTRIEETADTLRNTRARLALQSRDDMVGQILLNERRRAEDPMQVQEALAKTRKRLAQTQLRLIDLVERSNALASRDEVIATLQNEADEDLPALDESKREQLAQLLGTQSELVTRLIAAERELLRTLTELEAAQANHLDNVTTLANLLDRELLWFPSHERIGGNWFLNQASGWRDLLKPSRYLVAGAVIVEVARRQWPLVLFGAIAFALLLRQRRLLPQQLSSFAKPLLRVRDDHYLVTVRAMAATVTAAATWPLPMALLGWLLKHGDTPSRFNTALGNALLLTAGALFCYQLLRWMIVEDGVAQKHFRWVKPRRQAIARTLPWLHYLMLPTQFFLMLAFLRGAEPSVDTAARTLTLLACALGAWLLWRLLAPGELWTFRSTATSEPSNLRRGLRLGLVAGLAVIAILAINGYLLSAVMLLHSVWLSLLLALSLAIFYGMASRWFLLSERRLTLRRLESRRDAELRKNDDVADGTESTIDPEDEALSIQTVGRQTRRLLRALIIAMLAVGLVLVWSDILPALDRLDTVTLWSSTGTDVDGNPVSTPITLAAFLSGALVLCLSFIAARNLPGLVELSLLSRMHMDSGIRYAITSISRYLLITIGLIIGLSLLGIRWGQLQWLAAALTVGLSFGLQEIFANFVSGLIVLFERPYRVGDTISIGDVEGKVLRIRTRATTVRDSDNREVVVPNKTFITSRIINWTLSDTVSRVLFKLELPQNTDPDKVRKLLLDLAHANPLVLDQPAPGCWFTQINSGSYTFELRTYVAEMGHRTRLRDELNQSIARALENAGLATS